MTDSQKSLGARADAARDSCGQTPTKRALTPPSKRNGLRQPLGLHFKQHQSVARNLSVRMLHKMSGCLVTPTGLEPVFSP